MWFYIKYIVKYHSDRMFLARLCTFALWVGHLTTKPKKSHIIFIGWSFGHAAKTTIFASLLGPLTRTSQNNDIGFICWSYTPNKDIASWVGPLTRTSQNNDIRFICWSHTPKQRHCIMSWSFNTDISKQRYWHH